MFLTRSNSVTHFFEEEFHILVFFIAGNIKIPNTVPKVYERLLEMQPEEYSAMPDPKPLRSISEEIYQTLQTKLPSPSHHAQSGAIVVNMNNRLNVGPIPYDILQEMYQSVLFRRPGKSIQKRTWTKITDTKSDIRKKGGVGTSHKTHLQVCEAIWALYDRDWKNWVMTKEES